MSTVYLGLGSNIGDREQNIRKALELLAEKCTVSEQSSLIETEPVGFSPQPNFLNGVAKIETDERPEEFAAFIIEVEKKLGRERNEKNGPRTIDIDILLWDDKIIDHPELTVPHARMHERKFVLKPLNEIAPTVRHPRLKCTIAELYERL